MGYCMRPLRKGLIVRALNLLQLRKLANIRLSWAVSDCLGHIVFHETSVQIGGVVYKSSLRHNLKFRRPRNGVLLWNVYKIL